MHKLLKSTIEFPIVYFATLNSRIHTCAQSWPMEEGLVAKKANIRRSAPYLVKIPGKEDVIYLVRSSIPRTVNYKQ
jgi:hypothetical protein